MSEEFVFSSIDLVSQCLIDTEKISAFKNAIKKTMKPGHVVLDIGTGSGILALLAARAGVKEVLALEIDEYIAELARNNVKVNNCPNVNIVTCDATTYTYRADAKFDMILMEMLTTGMVDEFQVQAINNLHKQNKISKKTILFPSYQETFVTLANFDFDIDGFTMPIIRHLWKHNENRHLLKTYSEKYPLNKIDFSMPIEERFSHELTVKATKTGVINGIYFTSKTHLTDEIALDDTNSLNAPVVIPISERNVSKGDVLSLKVSYKFGRGYQNFTINIT